MVPPDRAPDGGLGRLTALATAAAPWQDAPCRCARSASSSRAGRTATARPCGSATSTSRPRRRGAARTTARSSRRRLADVDWAHGTLVTPPTPDEPPGLGDDPSVAALLDEAEDIVNDGRAAHPRRGRRGVRPAEVAEAARRRKGGLGRFFRPHGADADRLVRIRTTAVGLIPDGDVRLQPRRARAGSPGPTGCVSDARGGRTRLGGPRCRPPTRRCGATAASPTSTSTASRRATPATPCDRSTLGAGGARRLRRRRIVVVDGVSRSPSSHPTGRRRCVRGPARRPSRGRAAARLGVGDAHRRLRRAQRRVRAPIRSSSWSPPGVVVDASDRRRARRTDGAGAAVFPRLVVRAGANSDAARSLDSQRSGRPTSLVAARGRARVERGRAPRLPQRPAARRRDVADRVAGRRRRTPMPRSSRPPRRSAATTPGCAPTAGSSGAGATGELWRCTSATATRCSTSAPSRTTPRPTRRATCSSRAWSTTGRGPSTRG